MATSGEEEPTEACVNWMCGEHLVRIINTVKMKMIIMLKCVSGLVSLH